MDEARRAAVKALVRLHRGAYTAEAMDAVLAAGKLQERDRAFAAAIFFTATEHLVTLDAILTPFLRRPLAKLDVEVRAILECGLCQMRYMRVPPSAAVNEAVALARGFGKTSAGGFINAVLRKAASAEPAADAFSSLEEQIALRYSLSPAVAVAIMQALPTSYEAFLQASWAGGALHLRCNALRLTAEELAVSLRQGGAQAHPGPLRYSLVATLCGSVVTEPGFLKGLYHVQNLASQYASACVGANEGKKVLDICAAPGGKSATLAQMMGGGKGLTVCDINPRRLEKAKALFARLGIEQAQFLVNDAAEYREDLAGQDAVLCDVPCSGLGVLAAKPDLRYMEGKNFASLPLLQLKILETAARYVKKGGRLIYSTCTICPAENEQVVKAFLAKTPDFRLVEPLVKHEKATMCEKMMTFLPQNTQTAGFFVASIERL